MYGAYPEAVTGWPRDVYPEMFSRVRAIADDPRVTWFDVGRSVTPPARCDEKGCTWYEVIYVTGSIEHAKALEGALRRCFCRHPKFAGGSCDARGGTPVYPGPIYVYVVSG